MIPASPADCGRTKTAGALFDVVLYVLHSLDADPQALSPQCQTVFTSHHILNTSSLLVVYNSSVDDVTVAELLLVEALTVSTVIVYVNRLIWGTQSSTELRLGKYITVFDVKWKFHSRKNSLDR